MQLHWLQDLNHSLELSFFRSSVQGGDPIYRKAWAKICDISRTEFAKVYQRLQIELEEKVKRKRVTDTIFI